MVFCKFYPCVYVFLTILLYWQFFLYFYYNSVKMKIRTCICKKEGRGGNSSKWVARPGQAGRTWTLSQSEDRYERGIEIPRISTENYLHLTPSRTHMSSNWIIPSPITSCVSLALLISPAVIKKLTAAIATGHRFIWTLIFNGRYGISPYFVFGRMNGRTAC